MKHLHDLRAALALGIVFAVLGFMPANAADASTVVIPWGSWASDLLATVGSLVIGIAAFAVNKWAPAIVKPFLSDALIAKAVNYGFGAVEGVVAGKELDLKTTNAVINAAASFAVSTEPKVAAWVGTNLKPLILAKLSALGVVPAEASAASTGAGV